MAHRILKRFRPAMVVVMAAGVITLAEPPVERTIVTATADAAMNRVLVRWQQVEGSGKRFTHYNVLRREAGASTLAPLNLQPIGALTTVAELEALFTLPGLADALAAIQETFGTDYASDMLALQSPGAGETERLQLALLPDLNYGAALALGLGWMDDTVVAGTSYVYEVWGLDPLGFPEDRLGRATATAGAPQPLAAPASATCVDPGDARAHMAAFLRWEEGATSQPQRGAGYELYRAARRPNLTCPPLLPGSRGVSKANRFPTMRDAPGAARAGEKLFAGACLGCHAGGRDVAPVAGKTLADFRRRQYPELWDPSQAMQVVHDTNELNALSPESLEAIFDWIEEFNYRDDGSATPSHPLVEGETYCYQVYPRDLLGRLGPGSPVAQCMVKDREAPEVPYAMTAQRVVQGGHEICEISWDRNAAPGDDTAHYELMRSTRVPRLSSELMAPLGPPPGWPVTIAQPPSGARVVHLDTSQTPSDAGQPFYYAARAVDDAGEVSGFSGWVPCVPRDIAAPGAQTVSLRCCDTGGVCAERQDAAWIGAGGERAFLADPGQCPLEIDFNSNADAFGVRLYRSFDGISYLPHKDCTTGPCVIDYAPTIDQKIWYRVRPFDKSWNLGAFSAPLKFYYFGQPLPPPRIISVAIVNEITGRVEIRFRSVQPGMALGFALYKQHESAPGYQLVVRHHNQNLSANVISPGQWVPQPGAQALNQIPGFIGPPAPGPQDFLYYDDLEGEYVLNTVLGDTAAVTLKLVAISWSGQEGNFVPYVWDGWTPGDGFLDWPEFRDHNYTFWLLFSELTAAYNAVNNRIDLSWEPHPDGCTQGLNRPFVVYRKRGGATKWTQISPPFVCSSPSQALMIYRDTDVEPGMSYTYTVVRQDAQGEFSLQFGPKTEAVP